MMKPVNTTWFIWDLINQVKPGLDMVESTSRKYFSKK